MSFFSEIDEHRLSSNLTWHPLGITSALNRTHVTLSFMTLQKGILFLNWMKSNHWSVKTYSKTCLEQPLKKRPKIGFQDWLSLSAGQKYRRMPQESIPQYFQLSLS